MPSFFLTAPDIMVPVSGKYAQTVIGSPAFAKMVRAITENHPRYTIIDMDFDRYETDGQRTIYFGSVEVLTLTS